MFSSLVPFTRVPFWGYPSFEHHSHFAQILVPSSNGASGLVIKLLKLLLSIGIDLRLEGMGKRQNQLP